MPCRSRPIQKPTIFAIRMVTTEEREGNRVTDQLNDPHASVFPPATAIRN